MHKIAYNVTLHADNQIKLAANRNTNEEHSTSQASSASIGVSMGTSGTMLTASASGSRGKGDGSDSSHTNTHVTADQKLTLSSGGDTTLQGATAAGKQVTADIGGNLQIESLQDTSDYHSRQESLGGSISVGMGKISGSLQAGQSKVDGNYQSVIEQSGILAGDDGFTVNVHGHTDLKGGKIASADTAVDAGKNSFTTGSLTLSDIENKSDYQAHSVSVSIGGGHDGTQAAMNGTGIGYGSESGSEASVTKAGISGLAGDTSVRSDNDSSSHALIKNWDGKELQQDVEAQAQIMEAFGKQAGQAIGDFATRQWEEAIEAGDDEAEKNWGEGGIYRVMAHTLAGALAGGVAGAAGAGMSAATIADVADAIKALDLPEGVTKGLIAAAGTAVGAVAGGASGAAAGFNQTVNNYLKHEEIEALAKARKACAGGDKNSTACGEVRRLEALDKQRDIALNACTGNASTACNAVRKEVQQAAADIIRYGNAKTDLLNNTETQHTKDKADDTLSSTDRLAGTVTGYVETTTEGARALSQGFAKLLQAVTGGSQAQEEIAATIGNIGRLTDPEVLAQVLNKATTEQRNALADAYEKGDAFAIGKLTGNLLTNVVPLPVGSVGKVGKALKEVESSAKNGSKVTAMTSEGLPTIANKPLNLGSTGRTVPSSLQEQLAMQQAISIPTAGYQLPIPMTDARWPSSDGWVKMSQNVNGVEIHYVRNTNTGAIDDFKFK